MPCPSRNLLSATTFSGYIATEVITEDKHEAAAGHSAAHSVVANLDALWAPLEMCQALNARPQSGEEQTTPNVTPMAGSAGV